MTETILVTGGAGYIGSHVVVELAKAGYAPIVLDNFATSARAVLPRLAKLADAEVPLIEADVRDVDALRRAFHDRPITGVVHCAGLKAVGEAEARPLTYYDVNVGGAFALTEVMGEAGVASLVYSSSATVYGQPEKLPVTEDALLAPQSVYGRTKRVVEDFLRDLARANPNWRIAVLRYFTAAGAHPSGLIGEAPCAVVTDGKVESLAVRGQTATGQLKGPEMVEGHNVTTFTTMLPASPEPDLFPSLRSHAVTFLPRAPGAARVRARKSATAHPRRCCHRACHGPHSQRRCRPRNHRGQSCCAPRSGHRRWCPE